MNRLVKTMIMVLVVIALIGAVALFVVMKLTGHEENKKPSADEIVESSVDIPEIMTNLVDGSFIKVSFKIQTNSEDAKAEAEKRDFQIKNIIIEELSEMKPQDFKGKQGMINLENRLKQQINQVMQEGKVEQVYITSFILQ
ncbi:flagellar basal body-associated protein FliL [Thermaerobacillus caldiproteolyticus]|uniref:Flagellar protein FliL n=1 Tax=Thermaerobacillus caldiproteolyticus TaxID=247480 RepID=A0A7W0BXV9_9BACL|nr:flagellar basal body-associated protein FliL [Anoxybacillus caldiproteolyticus]MBA2873985.1 flagellar FliL protein [Anoxybacillus caldiproteolyticus]QPA32057.1 flagellar basal body-associated protein FliL [Anoxybacillus caldiproteolyticus]